MTSRRGASWRTLTAAAACTAVLLPLAPAQAHEPLVTVSVLSGDQVRALEVPRASVDAALSEWRSRGATANVQVGGFRPHEMPAEDSDDPGTYVPDPLRPSQWNMDYLDIPLLHERDLTGSGIVVAVIDTGVDARHPDLVGQTVDGYDAVTDTPLPAGTATDPYGHGTHVAGIIAAHTGNGIAVASVAPGVKIMPLRVLNENGEGYDTDVVEAILWAVDNDADVINLSLGGPETSAILEDAVMRATKAGIPVVASAGNSAAEDNEPSYPAVYPEAIAVASHGADGQRSRFSTTGAFVDISAPGSNILSTMPNNTTEALSGTSMSAPHVSAALAILLAQGLAVDRATGALMASASDAGAPGRDDEFGEGILNITKAWELASGNDLVEVTALSVSTPGQVRATVPFPVTITATGRNLAGTPVDLVGTRPNGSTVTLQRSYLDDDGTITVNATVPGQMTLTATAAETESPTAAPAVTRYVSIESVTRVRAGVRILLTRSDPAAIGLQWRKAGKWTTAYTMAKGGTTLKLTIKGKVPAGTQLRIQAPAAAGMLSYTSPAFRVT